MPLSIADLAQKRRTFTMETEYGPVQWTYRPYQMTPAREAEIARLAARSGAQESDSDVAETERGIDKLVIQFCEIVEATDMVGPLHKRYDPHTGMGVGEQLVEAGDTVPIRPDVVRYFSGAFIVQTLRAIGQDARPKRMTPED